MQGNYTNTPSGTQENMGINQKSRRRSREDREALPLRLRSCSTPFLPALQMAKPVQDEPLGHCEKAFVRLPFPDNRHNHPALESIAEPLPGQFCRLEPVPKTSLREPVPRVATEGLATGENRLRHEFDLELPAAVDESRVADRTRISGHQPAPSLPHFTGMTYRPRSRHRFLQLRKSSARTL